MDELDNGNELKVIYMPLNKVVNLHWGRNSKKHDIGGIVQSIKTYGFKDPVKYEKELNEGKGGIVEGNGRIDALEHLWKQKVSGEYNGIPKGITESEGEWLVPVLIGVDADTTSLAEAYGIDHNNLTMTGGDFTIYDISKMWDVNEYNEVLQDLAKQDVFSISMDANDVDVLEATLSGLSLTIPENTNAEEGEARKTKITLVLDVTEVEHLETIVAETTAFIESKGWKVSVDV